MPSVSDIIILIPSYEPDEKLVKLVEELSLKRFYGILIVDDGSTDKYKNIFDACRLFSKCTVIGYGNNRGKGRALKTGFEYIIKHFPDCEGVVTADCDGQHKPGDIEKIAREMTEHPGELVIGARNCLNNNVPLRSRFGNLVTRNIFAFLSGIKVKDTQTGLRGIPKSELEFMLSVKGERFEYEMHMLMDARQRAVKIRETDIETIYIEDNKSTHFRTIQDSALVYSVFVKHICKFVMSSLLSSVIDWGLFTLLLVFVFHSEYKNAAGFADIFTNIPLLVSFTGARLVSSLINFIINRKLVFKDRGNFGKSVFRYYLLVAAVAVCTFTLLSLFVFIHIPAVIAQPLATVIMFILSYYAQRVFVF